MSFEQTLKELNTFIESTLVDAEIFFALGDASYENDGDQELREYYYAHACESISRVRKREEMAQTIRSML